MATTIPSQALTGGFTGVKHSWTDSANNALAIVRNRVVNVQPPEASLLRYLELTQSRGSMWNPTDEGDPVYWEDDGIWPQEVTLGAAFTDADTGTMTLADTTYLKKGYVLQYNNEFIRCTADPASATTVAVKRNFPSQTGLSIGTIANGTTLRILTQAQLQGADKGLMMGVLTDRQSNNYQIIEMGTGIRGSQLSNDTYVNSNQFAYQMGRVMRECRRQLNDAMLFSPAATTATSTVPGTMKGIAGFITENVLTVNGRGTYDVVQQAVMMAREFNDDQAGTFALFCSEQVAADFTKIGEKYLQTPIDLKEFNFKVNVLGGDGWRVEIVPSFAFRGPNAGRALLISPQNIGMKPKRGRDWTEEMDVQTPGADRKEALYRGEFTVMVRNQLSHVFIDGLR